MGINYNKETGIFHLKFRDVSYVMQLFRNKYLVHLYWGSKIEGKGFGHLLRVSERAFSPNPDKEDRSYSLDTLPLEYPAYGNTDFRIPAFSVEQENGSLVTDLTYHSHRIFEGKLQLEGLPSTYVEGQEEATTLEIILNDAVTGLKLILTYTVFEAFNCMTRHVKFINGGTQRLSLEKALSVSCDFHSSDYNFLQLSGAWARERHIYRRPLTYGLQSIESRRGMSSHQQNPFFALLSKEATEDSGDVYGFSLVYSGNFMAGVEVDQFDGARAFMGINPSGFRWALEPGAEFQTPEVVMTHSSKGLGDLSRNYHTLYRTRLCRGNYRDQCRPILINNWEATYFDFNSEKILDIAKQASEVGIELMVLDDGWFGQRNHDRCSLGDWVENPTKFTKGLKGLAEEINALGMQFGLWFEPEMVSPDSDLYRQHPDWCIHIEDREPSESRNQLVLDLSRDEVCEALIDQISQVLSNIPIAYVKWDCNRNLTEIGSPSLPYDRQQETAHRYVLGLYKVMETITLRFPEVLFESCSGGGGRFDPGMLYYMPQAWTSDDTDAIERLKIQYGTSIVYPASTMGAHVSEVPNHQVHRTSSLETRGNVAMMGNFGYEIDITKLSERDVHNIKAQVHKYKDIRELVQFGNLYRLKNPFEGNEGAWMYVSGDKHQAVILFAKVLAKPNEPFERIKLKGLKPELEYHLLGGEGVYGGDYLMKVGLNVPVLLGDFQSTIWRLKVLME